MTFFRRLRRLRRPVAVLLLVCAMSFFVCPAPSHAVAPLVAIALTGLRVVGQRGAMMLARSGAWARATGGLTVRLGSWRAAGSIAVGVHADKIIDAGGKLWKWAKNHPGDVADIAGLGLDAWQALMGEKGMPHTADAVGKALNPSGASPDNPQIGDKITTPECGTMEVYDIIQGYTVCAAGPDKINSTCFNRPVNITESSGYNCSSGTKFYRYDLLKLRQSTPDTPNPVQNLPETLTPEQANRLLNEIEKKLRENKEEMERELDELLKKNLDDIDWPDFDNDEAQRYLNQQKGQDLQNKIDEVQDEIERRRQEREQNCQGQQTCQNQCCETNCDDARLANRLDQLKDRLDDLNQRQAEEALREYNPPVVPEVELKRIDFQPVVDLKGELMTKFPFNMLQAIPAAFQLLTAEPQAPYFDINLGVGGVHRVDFAVFDSVASFIRLVLTFLIYIAAVFCCLKIWSRF